MQSSIIVIVFVTATWSVTFITLPHSTIPRLIRLMEENSPAIPSRWFSHSLLIELFDVPSSVRRGSSSGKVSQFLSIEGALRAALSVGADGRNAVTTACTTGTILAS